LPHRGRTGFRSPGSRDDTLSAPRGRPVCRPSAGTLSARKVRVLTELLIEHFG
jgi:hypothetical protein